jgi:hypothetical protein
VRLIWIAPVENFTVLPDEMVCDVDKSAHATATPPVPLELVISTDWTVPHPVDADVVNEISVLFSVTDGPAAVASVHVAVVFGLFTGL